MAMTKNPGEGKCQKWWIYILGSMNKSFKNYTYIGMSMNVNRRIKEHNKELFGGGIYTSKKGPWEFLCHISGFPDQKSAI